MTRRAGVFSYSKSITEAILWAQKARGAQHLSVLTRRAGVFSYSKSITEAMLWAQKGQGGPATIGTLDLRKQRFEEKSDVTLDQRSRESFSISMRLLLI